MVRLLTPEPGPTLEKPTRATPRQTRARTTTLLHGVILLVVAVIATRSMWEPALLAGHSAWFDLARMVEFDAAVRHGEFLPAWSPDFYFGYGSPLFQFYSPLAYYLTEIPVLAGLDFPTALKVAQLVALFASGLAMYRLAVTHLSGWAACLGGVLYMVAPYRLVDIFVRHALAEHCAFIWLPLIIWGTERYLSQKSRAGLITGLLATAGLILTHNVMALIGLPVCVAAGWVLGGPTRGVANFATAGVPALLGTGLATFFWWPAISGRPLTHAAESLTGGYFDFHRHFVDAARFIALDWGFGESGGGTAEKMSLQIGLPHLFAALGALALILSPKRLNCERSRPRVLWCLVALAIVLGAVLMCSRLSQPLWEALPLVNYVQFPWRFLGLAVLGTAMCGAALVDRFAALHERAEMTAFLIGLIAVMAAYFPYYSQARFLAGDARTNRVAPMSADQLDALTAANVLIPVGHALTPDDLRQAGERATSGDDFLPRGVSQKPTHPPVSLLLAAGQLVPHWTRPGLNDYRLDLHLEAPTKVELQQFWFPGWSAKIDGANAPTAPSGPFAIVSCDVPAGNHLVEFRYHSLPQRRTGLLISLLSLALAAWAVLAIRPLPEKGGRA